MRKYQKDPEAVSRLSREQYRVTQESATERPFQNEFWYSREPGLYVDIVSGEPLFTSLDKFDSGCGWPSFYQPADESKVDASEDNSHGMRRVEVTCSRCGSHLGHVFPDGPRPTGLRYCINSVSLKLDPKEEEK